MKMDAIDAILRRCWRTAADQGVERSTFVLSHMAEYFITKTYDHPLGSFLYGHDVEVDPDLDGFVAYIKVH